MGCFRKLLQVFFDDSLLVLHGKTMQSLQKTLVEHQKSAKTCKTIANTCANIKNIKNLRGPQSFFVS